MKLLSLEAPIKTCQTCIIEGIRALHWLGILVMAETAVSY